ncbi:MAG: hypothetical protein J6Z32_05030 [Bacteroidales bacterium]|nr:hypothetical protein [Bacteroidales bacterium]
MKKIAIIVGAVAAVVILLFATKKYWKSEILDGPGMEMEVKEEVDTALPPMFFIGNGEYLQMLYWSNVEEPKKENGNEDYFDAMHQAWERQELLRRNFDKYTNMLVDGKTVKVKFVDEILKDPDGNTPSIGEIHGRPDIPALCARYTVVDPKDGYDKDGDNILSNWGAVIVTDDYLNSRKRLDVKYSYENADQTLSPEIVSRMEKEYNMKAQSAYEQCKIGDRYIHATIEFKGEYKNAPKEDEYSSDRKYALALELIIDSGKVYKAERLGYYDPEYGTTWNADADGYIPNHIIAAFEGPKGLELCFSHGAPESFVVGMMYLRDSTLEEVDYEMYHTLIDEEKPMWKHEIAEICNICKDKDPKLKDVKMSKWSRIYVDYNNEWIWLADKDDKHNAFLFRPEDGKSPFTLVDSEGELQKIVRMEDYKNAIYYLKMVGPKDNRTTFTKILTFKNSKKTDEFYALAVDGEFTECTLNGQPMSIEDCLNYLGKLPEERELYMYFREIE